MKFILSKKQYELLSEQPMPVKESVISKLFSILNKEKKKHKKRSELLEAIKKYMVYFSIPKGMELYILDLYAFNYRKDGDYSSLTKGNFIDPRKQEGRKITNRGSSLYTKAQMPFRGSNMEGYWSEDTKGVPYYVVKSYNWYPIYIFKEGRWYEVIDRYSSTTGKQMSQSNPIRWDDDIKERVFLLTKDEMGLLERYADHSTILKKKMENLKSSEKDIITNRLSSLVAKASWAGQNIPEHKIKYKVNSVDKTDDKVTINVDIYDVLKSTNGFAIETPENYLKGELGPITKEDVEKELRTYIVNKKLRKFVGTRMNWGEDLPGESNITFNFNHLRK